MSYESEILSGLLPIVAMISGAWVVITALNNGFDGTLTISFMMAVSAVISGGVMYKVGKRKA